MWKNCLPEPIYQHVRSCWILFPAFSSSLSFRNPSSLPSPFLPFLPSILPPFLPFYYFYSTSLTFLSLCPSLPQPSCPSSLLPSLLCPGFLIRHPSFPHRTREIGRQTNIWGDCELASMPSTREMLSSSLQDNSNVGSIECNSLILVENLELSYYCQRELLSHT